MFRNIKLSEKTAPLYGIYNYYKNNTLWNIFFDDYQSIKRIVKKIHLDNQFKNIHSNLNLIFGIESKFKNESFARLFFFFSSEEDYSIIKTYMYIVNRLPLIGIKEVNLNKVEYHSELLKKFEIIKRQFRM